ncbi:hypothetical protein AB0G79_09135 [Streptomyces sp. NPDC020807]|uniref:hypothetical protein n=1 Tax=Streptomyces sp. NPDC020807 TaxID=3155119 RepID=UPI0033D2BD82
MPQGTPPGTPPPAGGFGPPQGGAVPAAQGPVPAASGPTPGYGQGPGPAPAPAPGWSGVGTVPPPPAAPPGYGPGGGGADPRGRANPAQAAMIGLLNLSCLGLGYVLLRNWIGAVLCWIATVALLVVALPADVDGVPRGVLIGYGVVLLAAAVDGARRGLRATLRIGAAVRRLALPLAVVLLAVPAGGTLAYGAARDEAKEQQLLDMLAAADALVKSADGLAFAKAEPSYATALTAYQDLGLHYAGSRAGKLVPARLDAYYETLSAPYEKNDFCGALAPLRHLRGLAGTVDKELLGNRPAKTDEPLARSLYECGTAALAATTVVPSAAESLNELMTTFPTSPHTAKVEPALRDALKRRTDTLDSGSDACGATAEIRTLRTTLNDMPDASLEGVTRDAKAAVQRGDFACGTEHFKKKEYEEAIASMTDYAKAYPDSPQAAHARDIAIAAEIAEEEPAAGKRLPPAKDPGGERMVLVISNDGPGSVEVLYTGPITGKVTLKACATCKKYQEPLLVNSPKIKACAGPASKYPKATLLLPAGDYQFLQKRAASGSSYGDTKASKTKIERGYSYTNCLYVTSLF